MLIVMCVIACACAQHEGTGSRFERVGGGTGGRALRGTGGVTGLSCYESAFCGAWRLLLLSPLLRALAPGRPVLTPLIVVDVLLTLLDIST
eukprot:scaffold5362_cov100-Isochrysis_galbana.AAC.6